MRQQLSSAQELKNIRDVIVAFSRLPFVGKSIPGAIVEKVVANFKGGDVITARHFVDVVNKDARIGWQVKSTTGGSPLTWNRAKIINQKQLILGSKKNKSDCQKLGNAIIAFCNSHAADSLSRYNLKEIRLSRLHVSQSGDVTYFEHQLCSTRQPEVFNPSDFTWRWAAKSPSNERHSAAFHGYLKSTGEKSFAWYGEGAYQIHFPGEQAWWPKESSRHAIRFRIPDAKDRLSIKEFIALLGRRKFNR